MSLLSQRHYFGNVLDMYKYTVISFIGALNDKLRSAKADIEEKRLSFVANQFQTA